jgi:Ni/Co efflux regulator RcnB
MKISYAYIKENNMHRGYRYLTSLVLTAALAAPVAAMAATNTQDNKNQENRQGENNKRYYDKGHKDYHTWDSNEDHAFQRYQTESHETRAFVDLDSDQQTLYWNWRHNNPD